MPRVVWYILIKTLNQIKAIMVAKLVGDQLTHPIYHALLEVKCIPILDEEPVVYTSDKDGKSVL